jgi:hypothetical protein
VEGIAEAGDAFTLTHGGQRTAGGFGIRASGSNQPSWTTPFLFQRTMASQFRPRECPRLAVLSKGVVNYATPSQDGTNHVLICTYTYADTHTYICVCVSIRLVDQLRPVVYHLNVRSPTDYESISYLSNLLPLPRQPQLTHSILT